MGSHTPGRVQAERLAQQTSEANKTYHGRSPSDLKALGTGTLQSPASAKADPPPPTPFYPAAAPQPSDTPQGNRAQLTSLTRHLASLLPPPPPPPPRRRRRCRLELLTAQHAGQQAGAGALPG